MAGGDTEAIDERLNGLVNLLQVVGIDGIDSDALVEEQKRMSSTKSKGSREKKSSSSSKKKASSDTAASSSDAQILEIIKKLQQAQADSPELLEALQNPQLMALASLAAQKQSTEQKQKPSLATSLDDVLDDDDNFPKIGPGYSDECSVISEMSTPTVMTRQNVAEEEHYREIKGGGQGPPMHIGSGGGGQHTPSPTPRRTSRIGRSASGIAGGGGKTKNMLSQVRPMAAARRQAPIPTPKPVSVGSGGAAAQRRLNYQMAMNKLQSTGFGKQTPSKTGNHNDDQDRSLLSPTKKQTELFSVSSPATPNTKERKSKSKSANSRSTTATSGTGSSNDSGSGGRRKTSNNNNSTNIDWGMTDSNGWPEFDESNTKNDNKDVFVDNDGFFSDDVFSSNEGFDAGRSPTTTTRRKKSGKSPTRDRSPPRKSKSSSMGSKKKPSRSDEKKSSRSVDDGTGTAGTTKRTHRVRKEKDNDHTSDNTRKSKEKEKSGNRTRKSSRRSSLAL
jgi:hypothetical protein